ncbi:MAG: hypothetical protein Ct9H90mP3_8640 [Flammeovirgaceae bacterium]|nr:MAG: hypothetical protein Ct9H90mP3_8640 [Flammeovirgaceae bacterium]
MITIAKPAGVDYWLTRDSVWRTNNFDLWIEPLKFIKESTNFILTLIRKSGNFQDKNAEKGFYIQKLDQNKNIQLVRITLSSDVYYYPQIRLGKKRINIMFMTKNEANNLVQYQEGRSISIKYMLSIDLKFIPKFSNSSNPCPPPLLLVIIFIVLLIPPNAKTAYVLH